MPTNKYQAQFCHVSTVKLLGRFLELSLRVLICKYKDTGSYLVKSFPSDIQGTAWIRIGTITMTVMMAITTTMLGNLLGARDIKRKYIILPSRSWRLCREVEIKKKIKIQCNTCGAGACQWYTVEGLYLCRLRQNKTLGIAEPLTSLLDRGSSK